MCDGTGATTPAGDGRCQFCRGHGEIGENDDEDWEEGGYELG